MRQGTRTRGTRTPQALVAAAPPGRQQAAAARLTRARLRPQLQATAAAASAAAAAPAPHGIGGRPIYYSTPIAPYTPSYFRMRASLAYRELDL